MNVDPGTAWTIAIQLIGFGIVLGRSEMKAISLRRDVDGIQKTLRNGISEKLSNVVTDVAAIKATCRERARHEVHNHDC